MDLVYCILFLPSQNLYVIEVAKNKIKKNCSIIAFIPMKTEKIIKITRLLSQKYRKSSYKRRKLKHLKLKKKKSFDKMTLFLSNVYNLLKIQIG